ncbi:protein phosphatase 2C domain-containing protein [Frankia gtarii]|uniref:protein phosphatase 2C domain-containing protein n=1 Tax=Frankia gtarii TaxID=2950102 RepID=UPI0021C00859|nr:protein phosphatase 2C domain-containing protein [Frankia gtarii]
MSRFRDLRGHGADPAEHPPPDDAEHDWPLHPGGAAPARSRGAGEAPEALDHAAAPDTPAAPRATADAAGPPSAAPWEQPAGLPPAATAGPGAPRPPEADNPGPAPDEPAPGGLAPAGSAEPPPAGSAEAPAGEPTRPADPWRLHSPPTAAPTVGKVLPAPRPVLAPATAFRRSMLSLDSVFVGGFHVAAGSLVGTAHLVSGSPCQDAYDFAVSPGGRLIVAIADGLGSRPHSQVGARSFCEGAVQAGLAREELTAADLLAYAARYAESQAGAHRLAPREIGFVGAVAVFAGSRGEIARVGDVSAFALADGEFHELLTNAPDEHVNIVTDALPEQPLPAPEVRRLEAVRRVVLCTDGLATDLRNSPGVRSWLAESWEAPGDVHAMGEALRFRRRGSHDDRTAVVISVLERPVVADSPATSA